MRISAKEYREQYVDKKPRPIAKWGKSGPTESQQQSECVEWFDETYPDLKELLYAIPNGGKRSKTTAAILKREGVRPGIPDLKLAVARNGFHGLYVEQKIKGNTTSPHQKKMLQLLSEQGYKTVVVFSAEEFKTTIMQYLEPFTECPDCGNMVAENPCPLCPKCA